MIVLGVILLAVVAAVAVIALLEGEDPTSLNLGGADLDTTARWVFLAGAVSVLLLVAGVALILSGLRRARSRRKEIKELKKTAGTTAGTTATSSLVTEPGGGGATPATETTTQSRVPISPQDPDERTHFESAPHE